MAADERRKKLRAKSRSELMVLQGDLVRMLDRYLNLQYGDPASGRRSGVLDGPAIARMAAAATLLALLSSKVRSGSQGYTRISKRLQKIRKKDAGNGVLVGGADRAAT